MKAFLVLVSGVTAGMFFGLAVVRTIEGDTASAVFNGIFAACYLLIGAAQTPVRPRS